MTNEFWDEKYDVDGYRYGTRPNAFVEAQALRVVEPEGRVLCLGAGEGRNAIWLAKQGFEVTAVDASQVGIEKLRQRTDAEDLQIEAIRADVDAWTPPVGGFDAVVMTFFHRPPEARPATHQKAIDALRPGGVVILEGFTPKQRELGRESGGPPDVELMFTAEMLREDFEALDIELLEELTVELDEGPGHSGPAEVVRMIARRTGA